MERRRLPRRVVALGGGTGLPMVLRGLRSFAANGDVTALTAVVAMTDDGGSSGRLRRQMGVLPPGDVRNCLVALSEEEHLLAGVFQHRYGSSSELEGHTVGNLILAALAEQTGSFLKAVEVSSRVLRTVGRILPATVDDVVLEAKLRDGATLLGETSIASSGGSIESIALRPRTARPTPGVLDAILEADLVVVGPGSLYTSVVPNLVVDGVGRALAQTRATVVFVCNLVREPGEPDGMSLADHFRVVEQHAGYPFVDVILANHGSATVATLDRYRAEGSEPMTWPGAAHREVEVLTRDLLGRGEKLRHDPERTADALADAWRKNVARATGNIRPRIAVAGDEEAR